MIFIEKTIIAEIPGGDKSVIVHFAIFTQLLYLNKLQQFVHTDETQ